MEVMHRTIRRTVMVFCVFVCLPVTAPAVMPPTTLPSGDCGSPRVMAQAARTGRAMVQQVLATGMPWSGDDLNEYVNRLGQNLVRGSGTEQAFTFYVVYDPEANAQAFPGGYVVVNSGVISLAESEGELASVLSHEIAHVNACHWQGLSWRTNLFELLVFAPAVFVGGPVGIALTSGSAMAAPATRARFNRSAEREADRLAVLYMEQSGYDPRGAVKMFERLERQEERSVAPSNGGWLASHPRLSERREALEKLLLSAPPPAFSPHDDAEFRQLRQQVREYDHIYARAVGMAVPVDESPPELTHRPQTKGPP